MKEVDEMSKRPLSNERFFQKAKRHKKEAATLIEKRSDTPPSSK